MLEINSNVPDLITDNEEAEYLIATPFSILLKSCCKQFGNRLENCGIILSEKGDEESSIISYAFYATVDGKEQAVDIEDDDIYWAITEFWESLDAKKYAGFCFILDAKTEAIVVNFVKPSFAETWFNADCYDTYENRKYYNKCVEDLEKINKQNK